MENSKIKNDWVQQCGLNVYYSNTFRPDRTYYRYMSMEALTYILKGRFMFKNPALWWDPYEKLMVNGDYHKLGFDKPATYAACFTELNNSEAHWKMYTFGKGPCIRVEFNLTNLIGAFCMAEIFEQPSRFYLSNVSYDLNERSIKAIGKRTSKHHSTAVPLPFTNDNYADLLMLKRKSFQWEKESRIIILQETEQAEELYLCYDKDIAKQFIKSIQIAPTCKPTKFRKLKKEIEKLWYQVDPLNPIKITQSKLFDPVPPIVFEK